MLIPCQLLASARCIDRVAVGSALIRVVERLSESWHHVMLVLTSILYVSLLSTRPSKFPKPKYEFGAALQNACLLAPPRAHKKRR
jgi:hypothetical protein